MQEFIVGGYIPFTDARLSFSGYMVMVGIFMVIWVLLAILLKRLLRKGSYARNILEKTSSAIRNAIQHQLQRALR